MSSTRSCYLINIPNTGIYNTKEHMFDYYVKKYGYEEYFMNTVNKIPQTFMDKLSLNDYFICIPTEIEDDFMNILIDYENCKVIKLP